MIPLKIHESGLKFHLSDAKNGYMEDDATDETYPPDGREDSLNIGSQNNSTVLKDSGLGLLTFQLSEVLEYFLKYSQPHFGRFGKRPIHLN